MFHCLHQFVKILKLKIFVQNLFISDLRQCMILTIYKQLYFVQHVSENPNICIVLLFLLLNFFFFFFFIFLTTCITMTPFTSTSFTMVFVSLLCTSTLFSFIIVCISFVLYIYVSPIPLKKYLSMSVLVSNTCIDNCDYV